MHVSLLAVCVWSYRQHCQHWTSFCCRRAQYGFRQLNDRRSSACNDYTVLDCIRCSLNGLADLYSDVWSDGKCRTGKWRNTHQSWKDDSTAQKAVRTRRPFAQSCHFSNPAVWSSFSSSASSTPVTYHCTVATWRPPALMTRLNASVVHCSALNWWATSDRTRLLRFQLFLCPRPRRVGALSSDDRCLSVCLSVCLPVPDPKSRTEGKTLQAEASWKLAGEKPMTWVTRDPV